MVGWVLSRREEESGDMLLLRPYLESNKLLESFFQSQWTEAAKSTIYAKK